MDSSFDLLYNSFGQLHYDSYEDRLFNTYLRFSKELHDYGVALQKEHHFLYDIDLTPLDQDELERYLELDKVVDFEGLD